MISRKVYITNWRNLNYTNTVLYIKNVNIERLRDSLEKSLINHLYRLDELIENNSYIMYIENMDLQNLDDDSYTINDLINEGHNIYQLKEDDKGYYVKIEI